MSTIVTRELDCGIVLVVETIPGVASAALSWRLPVGSAGDPADGDGRSAMFSEMIFRGAGDLDSRGHSEHLDRCGARRSASTQTHHLQIDATCLGDRLADVLPLVTSMVRSPALPAEAIDPVRSLCLQSLEGLNDEPQHLVMVRLREQHHPPPFNRSGYGDQRALETMTVEDLRRDWRDRCVPRGSILSLAGAVDADHVAKTLEPLLGAWTGAYAEPTRQGEARRGYLHVGQDTAQVHIALAYDAPPERHEDSMLERLATSILGGSTSGRLFTEVRQKRSLCYSVGASYRAGRKEGAVTVYAGTTPERAQETFDVSMAEIERLFGNGGAGITREEFDRAVIGLKSHLVMQGESTPARANALGADQFRIGRARGLEERARAVDAITLDGLRAYAARRDARRCTIVSIGPVPLEVGAVTTAAR